ncbi:MAG: TetR/AcrR family transcriptional regulator [Alphaproteobacteria bacterium]|nr:TetR/AcrR family transcriptional regulator [Alphaproteobacteria bacterium]MBU1513271.1 TetR/AcrR family transcriptional regulator [Alphaproteobacteria bacterium]MBU2093609.1 TetR/AcrR family transcriptional regulator [Alphaproteobacteria bacterium]MBU2151947.1 TetR/AcrR family transcriptional regulator [Alphaproteobacteria bacterium]MBU2307607.1 TetR/AcrR family transcriptional regulator [Alphaproteobacteria bacterium]
MPRTTGSHAERTQRSREVLTAAAGRLFATHGYAQTSTEAVLAATGLTRGALYHHFRDKRDLFEAVCKGLHEEATAAILAAADAASNPVDGLIAGGLAFVDHVVQPRVRRILLVEAPSVLGWERWNELDRAHGFGLLLDGVREAVAAGALEGDPEVLALMLNGGLNQAVVWAGQSDDSAAVTRVKAGFVRLMETLRRPA